MGLFHFSLVPDGRLILGTAETNANQNALFASLNSRFRIFRRIETGRKPDTVVFQASTSGTVPSAHGNHYIDKLPVNIQSLTEKYILQNFAPASLLVNVNGDIVYISGNTGRYLEIPSGKANMNVFAMARESLRYEIGVGFRKALQNFETVKMRGLALNPNDDSKKVDITIRQIEKPADLKGLVVISFMDSGSDQESKPSKQKKGKSVDIKRLEDMEIENRRLKEELQVLHDEKQSSQEELRSANEELQTINEELQSTNEELTTSKEEMQSLNEELQTINSDLQSKVDDYARVYNDMNNLLNSNESANLFLDKNLCIRRFTSKATEIFKLIDSDIGRPFTDQVTELVYPELSNDARQVLRTLVFVEKNIRSHDERWYKIRIMPYRTIDDKIDGLVITFTDISKLKNLESELEKARELIRKNNLVQS
jgi:two-component system CheB/CheR fusion protein